MTKAKTKPISENNILGDDIGIADLQGIHYELLDMKSIHPNKFNCNVMAKEDYQALIDDMSRMADPEGMDPIKVRKDEKGYEIIDGEHRWNAARRLGWKKIKAGILEDLTEEQALTLNFRINQQRGTHDPFKEAKFIDYLINTKKLSQVKVAEMLNMDRTTVNKRASILKIDKDVLKDVQRGTPEIPTSVLQVVAAAPTKEGQEELFEDFDNGESVRELEHSLKEMKAEYEEEQKWKKELSTFKFSYCPECKEPAAKRKINTKNILMCKNNHWRDDNHYWNHKTGKLIEEKEEKTTNSTAAKTKKEPEKKIQRIFRSTHTKNEVKAAVRKTLKKALNAYIDQADYLEFRAGGPYASSGKRITLEDYTYRMSLRLPTDQGYLDLRIEPKTYKDGSKLKVEVISPGSTLKDGPKKAQDLFEKMMKDLVTYGKKSKKKKKSSKKEKADDEPDEDRMEIIKKGLDKCQDFEDDDNCVFCIDNKNFKKMSCYTEPKK